jgi:NAD+ kinase
LKRIGILYNPRIKPARDFSEETAKYLTKQKLSCWQSSSQDDSEIRSHIKGTEMVLSVGGDGTVLRAARALARYSVPIVGVNLGKLGFLTELKLNEAHDSLPALIAGEGWIDERAMIKVELDGSETWHGLNDIVLGRGVRPRVINVEVIIDNNTFTTYKSDGVIVATATGSTGYSLAVHGPILYPQARDIVLNPICPHPTFDNALVLSPESVIELRVRTDHEAVLSVDGQVDIALEGEKTVKVSLSPYVTRLLRLQSRNFFYSTLVKRLVPK